MSNNNSKIFDIDSINQAFKNVTFVEIIDESDSVLVYLGIKIKVFLHNESKTLRVVLTSKPNTLKRLRK